jgi:phage anti-repressor protein
MLNVTRQNKQSWVNARELYLKLKGIEVDESRNFPKFFKKYVTDYGFEDGKDFASIVTQSIGGRPEVNYLLSLDCAKQVAMIQRTAEGKAIRDYLLGVDNKVQKGELFDSVQIPAILELVQFFAIHEFRKEAERFHFATFCTTHYKGEWHTYRISLLGYSKETLTTALAKIGAEYQSIEKSLLKLDKFELIRTSFIDLFLHLGKSEEYAKNVGELAVKMALRLKDQLTFDSLKSALFGRFHPTPEGFDAVVSQVQIS